MDNVLISQIEDGGFADIKNCWYYFVGKVEDKFSKLKHLSNYIDSRIVCDSVAKMSYREKLPIRFKDDEHITDFLNLYKSSKLVNVPCVNFYEYPKF